MKRKWFVAAMLAVLLILCVALSGCSRDTEKLRICVDTGNIYDMMSGSSTLENDCSKLLDVLKLHREDMGIDPEKVEMEIIPSDSTMSTERATTLQRIRTELMSGSGPDIFICATDGQDTGSVEGGRLFPYVDKAIEEGQFYPMDEYLDSFHVSSLEDYPAALLDGGKNKEGRQVVFPLRFSIPMIIYDQTEVAPRDLGSLTWQDVITGGDPLLTEQERLLWSIRTFKADALQKDDHASCIPCLWGKLVDFEKRELCFTEEELTTLIQKALPLQKQFSSGERAVKSWGMALHDMLFDHGSEVIDTASTDMTMFPLRNDSGGATARVVLYCAVNKNTAHPDQAAAILDYLLSTECYNGTMLMHRGDHGMPANQAVTRQLRTFTEKSQEEWKKACEQVNTVQYPSPIDTAIEEMMNEIQAAMLSSQEGLRMERFALGDIDHAELTSMIHRAYEKMLRLVDES